MTLEIEMLRCLVFVMILVSGNSFADMQSNRIAAKKSAAPAPPTYQIPIADVQSYFQNLKKTRTLSDQETMIHNLTAVAATLKAESISSFGQDAASVQLARVNETIVSKIKTHPSWDVSLSASDLKAIAPHLEIIKNTMGEKSYGWAWFLKQTGKTAEAKQILTTLFDERCAKVMQMTESHNLQSPMLPVLEVEQALMSLSTEPEKAKVQKKVQDVKVHVSNLRQYMIQT